MQTAISRLTKKYQATIPDPVRQLLHLSAGDTVAFDIKGGEVHLRKAQPMDLAFAQAVQETMGEWLSKEDEEAYRDL